MDLLRTCINLTYGMYDRWKYAVGTFRMRIEFTLDVKRSYNVRQVSRNVHALLYRWYISMYIYKQDAHY